MHKLDAPVQSKDSVDARELLPKTNLEICQLGVVEGVNGQKEQVMVLKFTNSQMEETYMGVFVPEQDENVFGKWVSEGNYESVSFGQLDDVKRERLRQFSSLNLAPAIVFHLALNTNLEFEEVRDNYPPFGAGKLAPLLAVASEQSGQGKTFLTAVESLRWGDRVMSADKFTDDNVERLVLALKGNGWNREMEGDETLSLFRNLRTGEKLPGESVREFQDKLWARRCEVVGLLLVDLPGMKVVEGVNTRPTNGFDAQRWAMPTYVISSGHKPAGDEFDENYAREVTEGFYRAIKDTWHLDEMRLEGLRKML